MTFVWFSFLVSITLLILVSRKNIWLGLLLAAFILGILNLSFADVVKLFFSTCTDYSILILALSVGIIPLIGGALERSGLIKNLVQSLNMRSKTFLFIAPAFMGMLSMPGGALLSAPVIASVGKGANKADYVAINIWFRHILVMIYPLAGLLATTKMAQLDLYTEVLYLLPGFLLLTFLGYFYLLRPIADTTSLSGEHNWKNKKCHGRNPPDYWCSGIIRLEFLFRQVTTERHCSYSSKNETLAFQPAYYRNVYFSECLQGL